MDRSILRSSVVRTVAQWSFALAPIAFAVACAEGNVAFESGGHDAAGGDTPGTGGNGGNGAGTPSACEQDCSLIQTQQCLEAVCNETTGVCEVVSSDTTADCDDGVFCTVEDKCNGMGQCAGGPANTCGLSPTACETITCNEGSQACALTPIANGGACTPASLCEVGGACTNGLCIGVPVDCFFEPVPNECYESVCNPANGVCEPQIGPDGTGCTDPNALCTVGKTCLTGVCVGGGPKDCTGLTQGCFNGVCETTSGNCIAQPVPVGGSCAAAANYCNNGECDLNGICQPVPTNEGGLCEDGNPCTAGETCSVGTCQGGAPVPQTVYFSDEFANNNAGWTLGTEWAIGPAVSSPSPGSCGAGDPGTDTTAGNNNGVAGVVIGGNAGTSLHGYYYLTSPAINTSSVPGTLWMGFQRWLNSDYTRFMANRVEVFNGATWTVLWETGSNPVQDPAWHPPDAGLIDPNDQTVFDLTAYKATNMQVRFGFTIGSSGVYTCSQWNVDDVTIANVICTP